MITTLLESLICAADMPVCGGKLVGVYFGDMRGHPWHSLNDCFPPDMEAVVLVAQYGYHQEPRIGHLGHEGLFVDEETGACIEDEDGKVTHWAWIDVLPELAEVDHDDDK